LRLRNALERGTSLFIRLFAIKLHFNCVVAINLSGTWFVAFQVDKKFEEYIYFADEDPLMYLVLISGCVSVGKILDSEIYRITQTTFVNLRGALPEDERITEAS